MWQGRTLKNYGKKIQVHFFKGQANVLSGKWSLAGTKFSLAILMSFKLLEAEVL